jgi:hypothetical protein
LKLGEKYFVVVLEIVFDEGCQTRLCILDGVTELLDRQTGAVSEKEPCD